MFTQPASSLLDMFVRHDGKPTDKWSGNIAVYENAFAPYRERPISLLEIGIQGGGSLEVWSRYFRNARSIVGVDIDKQCQSLTYDDERISMLVADATQANTVLKITQCASKFDIIIDDGSHKSGDIISTFGLLFPLLNTSGLYVIEDLHCSYWQEFDGGLFHPKSAMAFLRALTDLVNAQHLGIPGAVSDLLSPFGIQMDAPDISSISFLNSLCLISRGHAYLGTRILAGKDKPGLTDMQRSVPDQSENKFSVLRHGL